MREGGKRRAGREEGGESPAPAAVLHVYKLTPPRPSRPARAAANPQGSLCPGAHPFLPLWEPESKHLFRFGS